MRHATALVTLAVLLAPGGPSRAMAGEGDESFVTPSLVNDVEAKKARFSVQGRVGFLPDGAVLTVSLQVRDRTPAVEAAFFIVEVKDKAFAGYKDWEGQLLGPISYRTVVSVAMQNQNPAVRRFLSRELGYTSDAATVVASANTDLGTVEERATHAVDTLRRLRRFGTRIAELQVQAEARTAAPADDAFEEFRGGYTTALKQVLDEIGQMTRQYVVWYEAPAISMLEQCLRVLSRGTRLHAEGDPEGRQDVIMAGADLTRVRADIDSRLPEGSREAEER